MDDMNRTRQSKADRLASRIQASLAGKSARQVTIKAALFGPAAEVWLGIRKDAEGLGLDDQALIVALLDAGAVTLRKALIAIPRG